jgi:two-component system osmolarity sensor histidine kinase EnvZ
MRTFHLVLGALCGFLLVLAAISLLLLTLGALRPSVRQLAAPLMAVVQLVDALDARSPTDSEAVLTPRNIVRRPAPPPPGLQIPVPFIEALAAHLRIELKREIAIERRSETEVLLWIQSRRGDWLGIPMEPLRSLVAQFAILVIFSALALALLSAWWIAKRIAGPIERLATVAARLPEPVAPQEFRVSGTREVALLGDRLAEALNRIEQQRRERDLMLAGLSHDLRTPLMRLLLRIDLLEQIPEDEREALSADIAELDRRIDRFIEHARTGAEEPVIALDLGALLLRSVEDSRARGHPWVLTSADHALVRGQPGVLARLIDNLIDNAEQHGLAPFMAALDRDGTSWRLTIANALGDRTRSEGIATHRGFGLVLSRHIAQSHGGALESGPGVAGFQVVLRLPAAG